MASLAAPGATGAIPCMDAMAPVAVTTMSVNPTMRAFGYVRTRNSRLKDSRLHGAIRAYREWALANDDQGSTDEIDALCWAL